MGILTPKAVFALKSSTGLPIKLSCDCRNLAVNSLEFLFSKGKLRKEKAMSRHKQNNCKMDINC